MQVLSNPMKRIRIHKVVINIGVGRSGEPLERAKKMLEELTKHTPASRNAKKTIRDFNIHKEEPIATMVTLRGEEAINILKRILTAKNNQMKRSSFDDNGNVSFGIREHIDIPRMRYNPDIGIFGMDVSVALERPGYRVSRRRYNRSRVGKKHRINKEEAITFFKDTFNVEVI